jgi:hypothetical protein
VRSARIVCEAQGSLKPAAPGQRYASAGSGYGVV